MDRGTVSYLNDSELRFYAVDQVWFTARLQSSHVVALGGRFQWTIPLGDPGEGLDSTALVEIRFQLGRSATPLRDRCSGRKHVRNHRVVRTRRHVPSLGPRRGLDSRNAQHARQVALVCLGVHLAADQLDDRIRPWVGSDRVVRRGSRRPAAWLALVVELAADVSFAGAILLTDPKRGRPSARGAACARSSRWSFPSRLRA
jgi:hypothetical protein